MRTEEEKHDDVLRDVETKDREIIDSPSVTAECRESSAPAASPPFPLLLERIANENMRQPEIKASFAREIIGSLAET